MAVDMRLYDGLEFPDFDMPAPEPPPAETPCHPCARCGRDRLSNCGCAACQQQLCPDCYIARPPEVAPTSNPCGDCHSAYDPRKERYQPVDPGDDTSRSLTCEGGDHNACTWGACACACHQRHSHTCECCGETWEHAAYQACPTGGPVPACIRCWRSRYSDWSPAYGEPCPTCPSSPHDHRGRAHRLDYRQ